MTRHRDNQDGNTAGRHLQARVVLQCLATWGLFFLLLVPYALIRGLAEDLFPWRDGWTLERLAFHGIPTGVLQAHMRTDFATALAASFHKAWFGLPIAFGILITLHARQRLLEYFAWILAASYVADLFFLMTPLRPPWMDGYPRLLLQQTFTAYVNSDDNSVAAFPSLHAAIPLVIGLFIWIRVRPMRPAAWIAFAFAGCIGWSVVYLGEHWLVDVLAGYALAIGTAWAMTHVPFGRVAELPPLRGNIERAAHFTDASDSLP